MPEPTRLPRPVLAALLVASALVGGGGACTALAGIDDYAVGGGAGGSASTGTTHGGPGCVPTTCEKLGAACDTVPDGCGGTLVCPTACVAPETCNGAGVAHQCGCTKADCASQGKDCGQIDDKCGGTLTCGQACPVGQTCGANGHPNVCGVGECKQKTCAEQGVECGPAPLGNGCDGPLDCPPCAGGLVCESGACKCPETWTTTLPAKVLAGRLLVQPATVVGVGSDPNGKQAYAVGIDRCTGAVSVERSFLPTEGGVTASSAELHDLALAPSSAGTLLAVGAAVPPGDPGDGLLVELDPQTLAPSTQAFLVGSLGVDALNGIAEAPGGNLWMAGTLFDDKGVASGWLVKSGPHGADACGVEAPPGSGAGSAVAVVPGAANPVNMLFRDTSAQLLVASYAVGSCAPPASCGGPCAADGTSHWDVDSDAPSGVVVFGMATVDALAYVVGTFCPLSAPTDCEGFVRVVDLAAGKVRPEGFTYDLGGTTEAFLGVAIDGDTVYVTGAQGLDLVAFGNGELSSSKGVVVRLRRSDLVPEWIAVLPKFNAGVGVASESAGSLVVSGRTDAGSVVMRCAKSLCQ